jgi:hypothetical protein
MKKSFINRAMIVLFVLSLITVISACNKSGSSTDANSPVNTNSATLIVQTVLPENLLAAFDAHNITVTSSLDATVTSYPDYSGANPDSANGGCGGGMKGGHDNGNNGRGMGPGMGHDNGGGYQFRGVLRSLQLDTSEIHPIQTAIWNYEQCVQTEYSRNFAARKEVLYAAEQQRRAIMNTFRTAVHGVTDTAVIHSARATAMAAIAALNADTQTKLNALIDKTTLCNCWNTMITTIEAVLTPTQLTTFQTWLAGLKSTPCS